MTILAVALSYLVGSIPTGLWLGLKLRRVDIREHGSKNIGATNTMRVLGRLGRNSISRGATAGPSLRRAWATSSRFSVSLGAKPERSDTNALTTSSTVGSGLPITPASATAGCSSSALSTSKGPIRCPADLITSSARPTNQ
jgi:hypothetical protein